MKKVYSLILLLSFLVGMLRPVTPMVEHFLHESDVASIFTLFSLNGDDIHTCSIADLLDDINCLCCEASGDEMLDTDFYPVPIKYSADPVVGLLPLKKELLFSVDEQLLIMHPGTHSPPPRLG